jgi:serine/threonine-protein kinase
VKDLETRLQIVDWSDFAVEGSDDPLAHLRGRLERRETGSLDASASMVASRLRVDRSAFEKRFIERVRSDLINICGNRLPFSIKAPPPDSARIFGFEFTHSEVIKIKSSLCIQWLDEIYARSARVWVGEKAVCAVTISESEDQAVYSVSCSLAEVVGEGLDLIESSNIAAIKGTTPITGNAGQVEVE